MQQLFVSFYGLPIRSTVLLLFVSCGLWYLFLLAYNKFRRAHQLLCKFATAFLFTYWLIIILYNTVFPRSIGELIVHPDFFHQLKEYFFYDGDVELLRTLWMNVLLFVPGGLLLEALWPQRVPRWVRIPLTVIFLTALSVGIEATQYRYALGVVEADDVLCNGLGAFLGALIHEFALYCSAVWTTRHNSSIRK